MSKGSRPKQDRGRAPRGAAASYVRTNRHFWNRESDRYDRRFRRLLSGPRAMAWGVWRIPERELQLLGNTRGRRVLELGCGAARWSIALSLAGARGVGLDQSLVQLRHARTEKERAHAGTALVQADAERTPFRDRSFDVVFCDWGAMTFCDPFRTVPEVSRLLEPGGQFVFSTASPLWALTYDLTGNRPTRRLLRGYFDLHRLADKATVEFQLPYGDWIRLLRQNGLVVERLIEPRPSPGRRSKYVTGIEARWARHWPREAIWQAQKWVRQDGAGSSEGPERRAPTSGGFP